MGDAEVVVRFVKDTEELHPIYLEAFEVVKENGGAATWFSTENCLEVKNKDKQFIYLFPDFVGPAFEHIKSTGNRIYGAACVLYCLKNGQALPNKNHPVFSFSMHNLVISCSGIEKALRPHVHDRVQWMMGHISRDFHEGITHLVAKEVTSQKYRVAANLKKAVMSVEWVNNVWEASKSRLVDSTAEPFIQMKCPLFCSTVMTASGLDNHERSKIKECLDSQGGRYSGEMKVQECTHLLVTVPRGQKYEFAKKWKITIARPEWLYASVEAGYYLDPADFAVSDNEEDSPRRGKATSTPTRDRDSARLSILPDVSCISTTTVNETAMTTVNQSNMSMMLGFPRQSEDNEPDGMDISNLDDTLQTLDFSRKPNNLFLDGSTIFLCGFRGSQLEKLRKIINIGGGTRFNQLSNGVSHVIVGPAVDSQLEAQLMDNVTAHVVSCSWLLQCYMQATSVPEAAFLLTQFNNKQEKTPVKPVRKSVAASKPVATPSAVQEAAAVEGEDMDTLMSQYLPQPSAGGMETGSIGENTLMMAAEAASHPYNTSGLGDETVGPAAMPDESTTVLEDDDATQDPTESCLLFQGKTFVVLGFEIEDELELGKMITGGAGRVVNIPTRSVPDYAIVPVFGCPVTLTVASIATNAWLQRCIEQNTLLDLESDDFFTPVDLVPGAAPLEGCVLSVSGYMGTERDVIIHAAEILGAFVQEYFVKKNSESHRANTHLIVCEAQGSKYKAALKWKIPAITKKWIVECCRQNKKLKEEDFIVEPLNTSSSSCATPKAQRTPASSSEKPNTPKQTAHSPMQETPETRCPQAPQSVTASRGEITADLTSPSSGKENESTPALRNIRVQALIQETRQSPKINKQHAGTEAESSGAELTPSKFLFDPNYMPKFDLQGAYDTFATPPGARPKQKAATPFEDVFARNLEVAVKNSMMSPTGMNVDSQPPVTPLRMTPKGPLYGAIIVVAKKMSSQQSDCNTLAASLGAEYRWTYDSSCTHFIFEGRANDTNKEFRQAKKEKKKIVSPFWLKMCQEQNCWVDEDIFPHTHNPNKILSMTPASTTRSTRLTRRKPASVTEPDNKSSAVLPGPSSLSPSPPPPPAPAPARMIKPEPFNLDSTQSDEDISKACENAEDEDKAQNKETLVQNLKTLMAATRTYGRRKQRRTDSFDQAVKQGDEGPEIKRRRPSNSLTGDSDEFSIPARRSGSSRNAKTRSRMPDTQVEPSQMVEVSWEDPTAKRQRAALAFDLEKNSESFSPTSHHGHPSTSEDERRPGTSSTEDDAAPQNRLHDDVQEENEHHIATPDAPSLALPRPNAAVHSSPIQLQEELETPKPEAVPPPPVFLLSGISQQERTDYGALVEELGGVMSETQHYDPRCTHLVIGQPSRNEKFLACLSAGKWVLHKSYFEACRSSGQFVEESAHEWGSPATQALTSGSIKKLADAAHRWRVALNGTTTQQGAFNEWRIVLLTDKKKEDGFSRLLQAGGAGVVSNKTYVSHMTELSHAFIEPAKTKHQFDVEALVKAGVLCLKPEYIASFLMDSPAPEPSNFYPSELKAIINRTGVSQRKRKASTTETPGTPVSKRYCH